ncbi:hypothetical protein BDV97DRAFT_400201 [Delphinella strobiligena]|nr:hypothetical protein BDV97DRAFT_400201 [Delphinella strobiligena]
MSRNVPGDHRKKPLITYSCKGQRTHLSLDGAQFLKANSITPALPASGSADHRALHEVDSATFDCAAALFPSAQPSRWVSGSSMVQAGQRMLPAYELPMVTVSDSDLYVFAPPMSRNVSDQDSIIDDQVSITNAETNKGTSLHQNRPSRTLSVIRKALRLPIPHRSNIQHRAFSTVVDSNGITRGSDGFTRSELTVVPGTRRVKARLSRLSTPARTLDVHEGPHPNVDFRQADICESGLRLAKSAASEMDDEGCIQRLTTPSEASREMSFDDRCVYAQLTSVVAPRRETDLSTSSDNSEGEEYQSDLLGAEDEYLPQDEDLWDASQGMTLLDPEVPDAEIIPGQFPRQHLDASRWMGVDEEILDDGPSSTISDSHTWMN